MLAAADFQQPTAADCEPATAHEDMARVALATEVSQRPDIGQRTYEGQTDVSDRGQRGQRSDEGQTEFLTEANLKYQRCR